MKDLATLTCNELEDFFNSFDFIFSDIDGVIFNVFSKIPNTAEAVQALQNIGKRVVFLTNNTVRTHEYLMQKLITAGIVITKDDLITPLQVYVYYLKKKTNLDGKKIFVLGPTTLKNILTEAGFSVAPEVPDCSPDDVIGFVTAGSTDDPSIGVVISDVDFSVNYLKLQKAITFLRRSEVDFLKGPEDDKGPITSGITFMGPGHFHRILENMSGRVATMVAKKSPILKELIDKSYTIPDSSRVLFIGDSINEDIGCGKAFGYKTLLVFSGQETKEDVINWTLDENLKPDFYVEHLGIVKDLIEKVYNK